MKKRIMAVAVLLFLMIAALIYTWDEEQKPITIDVFASRANYQGLQQGWYAKLVEDKFNLSFNIIAPNVTGGGNLLFEFRLSTGKVGDIVIASSQNMQECINAGLLEDLTPYIEKTTYLKQYMEGISSMNQALGAEGHIYVIPTSMSTQSAQVPELYGDTPEFGSYLPWDYYRELGYPEINNMDELLDVLSEMQANHPYAQNGEPTYAFSLFKDWDIGHMSLVGNMAKSYGYYCVVSSIFATADLSETQYLVDDDSVYHELLEMFYEANQRGLLDPESSSQSFSDLSDKIRNKQILYLWWAWMAGEYNKPVRTDNYMFVPVSDQPLVCDGFSKYGDGYAYAVSNDTEDVGRIVEYLDWMASPEGMMAYCNGIEGISYVYEDGKAVPYGENAWISNEEMPEEYGGGIFRDGFCHFNDSIVNLRDLNPETGETYHSQNWSASLESNRGRTDTDWSLHYGVSNPAELLEVTGKVNVVPGIAYVQSLEPVTMVSIREKCAGIVTDYSWKMVFAENKEQFDEYWEDMKALLYQSGYELQEEADAAIVEEMRKSIE